MKKTFKKVVTTVTAAALTLVGAVTFNPADAKADGETVTTIHVPVSAGTTVAAWVDPSTGLSIDAQEADSNPALNWGGNNNNPQFVDMNEAGDYFDVVIKGEITAKDTTAIQILADCGTDDQYCCKYGISADDANGNVAAFNGATELWATLSPNGQWDGTVSFSAVDPAAITATDVEDAIAAIGEVTLESLSAITAAETAVENYLAVSDSYSTADISNYATLTAARATYDELKAAADAEQAAADAAAAGKLTLYVKAPANWESVSLWAWTSAGNLFDGWPGEAMTACDNNDGWYKATIETTGLTSIIFNNANGLQTKDIVDVAAGTYWYTLSLEDGASQYDAVASEEAPADWEEEEEAELEVNDPVEDDSDEDSDDETPAGDEDETASAWADAKLKIHVKMPSLENWDALGLYLFGTGESFGWSGGAGELSGSWPGAELKQEIGSETWYAFGGTFADGYYMAIINNYVSDAAAAEGAVKCQAADLELVDGEYWITIDAEETEDGIKYIATVVTEAPEDYDGEGLDEVAEDPSVDDEDADSNTDDSTDNGKEDPAGGNTAGLPVAGTMVVAMLAASVVVASRKRKVA